MSGTSRRRWAASSGCLRARSDDFVKSSAALAHEPGDLVPQDEVVLGRSAQDDRHVDVLGQVVEHGPHGGRADAGADEKHPVGLARVVCESAVRSLDRDPRARPELCESRAVVADRLDRDAHLVARRQGRQRVRVRLRPHAALQEAPVQELPAGDRQPVEVASASDDRHDAGRLVLDAHDLEPMSEAAHDRQPEAVAQHDAGGQRHRLIQYARAQG